MDIFTSVLKRVARKWWLLSVWVQFVHSLLGLGEFPDICNSRFREFPGIREKSPGNSRESQIHYIGIKETLLLQLEWIDLTVFGHISSNCGHIQRNVLIKLPKIFYEKNISRQSPNSKIFES